MAGINNVVGQSHEHVAHRVEQLPGQLVGLVVVHQIWPLDAVDEKGNARQQAPGRLGVAVMKQVGHVLGRMARGEKRLHPQTAEAERVTVAHRHVDEAVSRATLVADTELRLTAEAVDQLARAAHEIGMDMGFEDMRYGEAEAPCRLDVDLHVRAGINNGADMRGIVAHQVGTFGNAIRQDLLKAQGHRQSSLQHQQTFGLRVPPAAGAIGGSQQRMRIIDAAHPPASAAPALQSQLDGLQSDIAFLMWTGDPEGHGSR